MELGQGEQERNYLEAGFAGEGEKDFMILPNYFLGNNTKKG